MSKPKITTIVVIICIFIIGLYAMGEVNYFSSKVTIERNTDQPAIIIPKIGVNEKINDVSLSQGVLHEPTSYKPLSGDVELFGHRTLQGSPFLRLNELSVGDELLLEWPGIGEIKYTVVNSKIVPETYVLTPQQGGNYIYLITCDPIGSTANRLIIQGELKATNQLNTQLLNQHPQESNAFIISIIFLAVGLLLSLIYSKDQRSYILAAVLIMSAILFYFCFFPIPSELIYDKIIFLNGGI